MSGRGRGGRATLLRLLTPRIETFPRRRHLLHRMCIFTTSRATFQPRARKYSSSSCAPKIAAWSQLRQQTRRSASWRLKSPMKRIVTEPIARMEHKGNAGATHRPRNNITRPGGNPRGSPRAPRWPPRLARSLLGSVLMHFRAAPKPGRDAPRGASARPGRLMHIDAPLMRYGPNSCPGRAAQRWGKWRSLSKAAGFLGKPCCRRSRQPLRDLDGCEDPHPLRYVLIGMPKTSAWRSHSS
ncbi:MAG: hypothetical protein JWQ16_1740 [Novosphingobium sp.]|nr:hypothetical protein [Novosphingobium sp.]